MKKSLIIAISIILAFSLVTGTLFVFADDSDDAAKTVLTAENCEVTLAQASFEYNGKEQNPDVSVTYNNGAESVLLSGGTDYNTEYSNNVEIGTATVTVKGVNSYSGEVSKEFTIVPVKVSSLKMTSKDIMSVNLKWSKVDGVSGYELAVYNPNTKKWTSSSVSAKKTSYKATKLRPSTKYKFKIRAYKTVEKKNYYGEYSDTISVKTNPAIDTPSADGYCNLTGKPVVTWKKVKNAEKYIIYRSVKKGSGYKKIADLGQKKRSFTDKKVKPHKTYYYKVKAWRKLNGKGVFSQAAAPVKIKAKKTVLVGDSIMEGVKYYKALPGANYVVKIGMGTYTFYERNYFKSGKSTVTGVEKVISMKPDRVIMMFGMNEAAYKGNDSIIEYYEYAIEDIQEECKGVEIIILPVSPTSAKCGKNIPKKKRINSLNKATKKMAKRMGCGYYDFTAPFKDKNGYLLKKHNGGDGCHWTPSACKLFVDQLTKYVKENK